MNLIRPVVIEDFLDLAQAAPTMIPALLVTERLHESGKSDGDGGRNRSRHGGAASAREGDGEKRRVGTDPAAGCALASARERRLDLAEMPPGLPVLDIISLG